MRARLSGLTLLWRAAQTAGAASTGLFLVSALMSALLTAWVLGFSAMSDDLGDQRVGQTTSLTRDLSAVGEGWYVFPDGSPQKGVEVFDDPAAWEYALGDLDQQLKDFRETFSPALHTVTGSAQFRVITSEAPVNTVDGSDVRFPSIKGAWAPDLNNRVTIAQGRYPQQTDPADGVEIFMSKASADRLSWNVGDSRTSEYLPGTPLVLVGTYTPNDTADGYWEHATTSVLPYINDNPNAGISVLAVAYLAPNQEFGGGGSQRVDAWYPIDSLGGASPQDLSGDLTAISAQTSTGAAQLVFGSGLAEVLEHVVADTAAVKSLAFFLITVPMLALVMSAIVAVRALMDKHGASLYIASARGASRVQVVWWVLALCAALVIPAIACGGLAAWLLIDDAAGKFGSPLLWCGYLGIFLLIAALAVTFGVQIVSRRGVNGAVSARHIRFATWCGIAVAAAALAAGALYLVRSGKIASDDAISNALPVLVVLAVTFVGIVLLRVGISALTVLVSRRKGTALYLGFAQSSRATTSTTQAIATVIIVVSLAVMAGGLWVSLWSAISLGAQEESGADIRLSGPVFTEEGVDELRTLEGVIGFSTAMNVTPAALRTSAGQIGVRLYVAPPEQLATLRSYEDLDVSGLASEDGTLNVFTTRYLDDLLATDSNHVLSTGAGQFKVNPIKIRTGLDGLNQTNSFILASSAHIESVEKYRPTVLLVDVTAGTSDAQVRETATKIQEIFPGAALELQMDALDAKKKDPTVHWLTRGIVAGFAVTLLAGAGALWFAQRTRATQRQRDTYVLRQLGMTDQDVRAANLAGTLSWLLPALLWGCVGGAVLAWVALQVVDVSNITGLKGSFGSTHILTIAVVGWLGSFLVAALALLRNQLVRARKSRKS